MQVPLRRMCAVSTFLLAGPPRCLSEGGGPACFGGPFPKAMSGEADLPTVGGSVCSASAWAMADTLVSHYPPGGSRGPPPTGLMRLQMV